MARSKADKAKGTRTGLTSRLAAEAKKRQAADCTRCEELLGIIARKQQSIAESFYEIGEALREILRKKYFVAMGFASFEELLESRNVMGATSAFKLVEVVENFPRAKALELGAEKAYALARLADATGAQDDGQQAADSVIVVEGKKKKAQNASVRELAQAAREERAKARGPKQVPADEKQARAAARKAQAALRRGGIKGAAVKAVKTAGAWNLRVEVPLAAAEVLDAAWPVG